ncbi:sensor histidine kinase [Streptacidiphilus anmyonensis]|uniref:sensor histidine kinase n=1 Tax=Streptacidiphilus anmyonensis TaxID=405782 RepID=UPI001F2E4CE4|nr:sensor histidine kinase [Streptacidiphilus anmyonensis]
MTANPETTGTPGPESGSLGREDENRPHRVLGWIPYLGLAVAIMLALVAGRVEGSRVVVMLGLSALAAVWQCTMHVPVADRERRQVKAVVFYVGLVALIASLVTVSPFFGFFAFSGYLQIGLLPRRLWPPAIAVVAGLVATTQVGGVQNIVHGLLAPFLGLVVVNVLVAGVVTYQSLEEDQRSHRRARHIDELAEANRRLREALEENAGLHAQLVAQAREAGVMDERQRMAGEIHDTIAQGLTGIVTQLEAAAHADHDPERRARHRDLARRLAKESLAEARRSVQALRPGPLAEAQLPEAVREMADRWAQTSGLPVRVEVTGGPVPLLPAVEVVLFRVAQEGLANIAKHAAASRAGVTLSYTDEVVLLDVVDDGVGFRPGAGGGESYGLTAMRQRLRQIGGSLEIESSPGEGTALSAQAPVAGPEQGFEPGLELEPESVPEPGFEPGPELEPTAAGSPVARPGENDA